MVWIVSQYNIKQKPTRLQYIHCAIAKVTERFACILSEPNFTWSGLLQQYNNT